MALLVLAAVCVLVWEWQGSQLPAPPSLQSVNKAVAAQTPPSAKDKTKVKPGPNTPVAPTRVPELSSPIWKPSYEAVVAQYPEAQVYTPEHLYLPLHLHGEWDKKKTLTFWSSDFHIAPVEDIRHLFKEMGVNLIIESLSGHCHLTGTCAQNLKVLHRGLYDTPDNDLPAIRKRFYDEYKNDPRMKTVDAFICFHAVFVCEFFLPFNKSIIVLPSTRYEGGRESKERWNILNDFMLKIASQPRNVLGANNLYDSAYLHYFTGVVQ